VRSSSSSSSSSSSPLSLSLALSNSLWHASCFLFKLCGLVVHMLVGRACLLFVRLRLFGSVSFERLAGESATQRLHWLAGQSATQRLQ
jgi:hypothetical protein